mgnify:CR=1 FL=1
MCTAITYTTDDFYFGRTLDYDFEYQSEVTITPRNFPFDFQYKSHNAIIGMAYVVDNFPLYFDAANEKGLCMAGLNFVGNAKYNKPSNDKTNVAQYEFIPYILSKCATVDEAVLEIKKINVTDTPFSENLPTAELHYLIADKEKSVTVEFIEDGVKIYNNPVGVLTNNPPFDVQLHILNNFMKISPKSPFNEFSDKIELTPYSRGMGALGLPGDLSSSSRFVRAAFTKLNAISKLSEAESVGQFFHILSTVEQTRGCCKVGDMYEVTVYTSCINADKGIYYYTTYENRQINAVSLNKTDLESDKLICYPLNNHQNFYMQN